MRSEEFFNILDDIDDRIISEIYEDVQRPQKLTAVPRSPKRLLKPILSGAACVAVIAAAVVFVRFAAPEILTSLSPASETGSANDSGFDIPKSSYYWFMEGHFSPWKYPDSANDLDKTNKFTPEQSTSWQGDLIAEDYEIRAVDNGTVVFAGKISDEYGSGVVIDHNGIAYTAYGGLDPDSVTISEGDVLKAGEVFAKPKIFGCGGNSVDTILEFKSSVHPITEEYFKESCKEGCEIMSFTKNWYNEVWQDSADPDGMHHINADYGSEVKSLGNGVEVVYAGTDSDGSGMVVVRHYGLVYIVYKGLDTRFPDFASGKVIPKVIEEGETIGYVGNSGDAYWFVLDVHEFEKFIQENGIELFLF